MPRLAYQCNNSVKNGVRNCQDEEEYFGGVFHMEPRRCLCLWDIEIETKKQLNYFVPPKTI